MKVCCMVVCGYDDNDDGSLVEDESLDHGTYMHVGRSENLEFGVLLGPKPRNFEGSAEVSFAVQANHFYHNH